MLQSSSEGVDYRRAVTKRPPYGQLPLNNNRTPQREFKPVNDLLVVWGSASTSKSTESSGTRSSSGSVGKSSSGFKKRQATHKVVSGSAPAKYCCRACGRLFPNWSQCLSHVRSREGGGADTELYTLTKTPAGRRELQKVCKMTQADSPTSTCASISSETRSPSPLSTFSGEHSVGGGVTPRSKEQLSFHTDDVGRVDEVYAPRGLINTDRNKPVGAFEAMRPSSLEAYRPTPIATGSAFSALSNGPLNNSTSAYVEVGTRVIDSELSRSMYGGLESQALGSVSRYSPRVENFAGEARRNVSPDCLNGGYYGYSFRSSETSLESFISSSPSSAPSSRSASPFHAVPKAPPGFPGTGGATRKSRLSTLPESVAITVSQFLPVEDCIHLMQAINTLQ